MRQAPFALPLAVILLALAVIVLSSSHVPIQARYEAELTPAAKDALKNVYLEPCDPCDTIYRLIIPASDEWKAKYFDSERSRLIHNIGELNVAVIKATALLQSQGKRIAALEARATVEIITPPLDMDATGVTIIDPNAVDPNEEVK